jgi:hypothetical protein
MGTKEEISEAASALGKRSYRVRLKRFGLERLQEIARDNGKLGGRPKSDSKGQSKKGGK